ncbi:hypothetical protein SDC9_152557 [bioreactor metagenome]|uniref:HTH LytTR-type domain-containing protein n=1 Tax=bioreactor metagenome TaxID=1076179 RepID=A0A645ETY4_9ZZZZ
MDDTVNNVYKCIYEQLHATSKLTFFKENKEYYFPLDDVLFFETEGEYIYAHTKEDAYRIKYRHYELEEMLPKQFVRAAKSTIINTMQVYSITHNLTASSLVQFIGSHKQVYVSRYYYKELRQRINDRNSSI